MWQLLRSIFAYEAWMPEYVKPLLIAIFQLYQWTIRSPTTIWTEQSAWTPFPQAISFENYSAVTSSTHHESMCGSGIIQCAACESRAAWRDLNRGMIFRSLPNLRRCRPRWMTWVLKMDPFWLKLLDRQLVVSSRMKRLFRFLISFDNLKANQMFAKLTSLDEERILSSNRSHFL